MIKSLLNFCLLLLFCPLAHTVDFNRDIRPILSDKCFACHGFDEHDRKADLRLDTKEGAFADLGGYSAIVAGKPDESEAWYRIISEDEDELMPPPKFHKPLTAAEKSLIKQWIEEGAEYKTHWSYTPLERREVPQDKTAIDFYIGKALAAQGLDLSPAADKVTLARRLYFDLLGLAPNPSEVDAFVNDKDPKAWEKLVDRLLANPAFGERMAVYWLDLVRYADTIGYHSDTYMEVSAYRDYVISAFNKNLPYDQFTIEQLAGDLLPEPTLDQKIASGYNRLLQTTEEGGAQAEEYKTIYAADRVRNVSGVWLGSTIGCAQCHDHKYDPFTARDFYTLAAFFADLKEKPVGKRQPNLKLPTDAEKAKIAQLQQKLKDNSIANVLNSDPGLLAKVDAAQITWEDDINKQLAGETDDAWKVVVPGEMKSSGGQTFKVLDDESVITSGANPAKDNYTISLQGSGLVTAIRLEALRHDSFPRKSLSRGNGNFVLTGFKITAGENTDIKVASAKADYEQKGWPVANTLDGRNNTGWAVDGQTDKAADRVAMFLLATPVDLGEAGRLKLRLEHQSVYTKHNIGRFRLSVTDSASPMIRGKSDLPGNILSAVKLPLEKRTQKQITDLRNHYRKVAPLLSDVNNANARTTAEIDAINKSIQTMLVSEALPTPRMTRLLHRGDWLDKDGEVVEPALPAFLPRSKDLPNDRRGNRLDLAKWIVEPGNPLTSRTLVNRVWMLFFGEGISRNVDDLGGQGEPPTHPELLDYLALEFRENGWDVKALIREILLSETYRQTSVVSAALAESDPTNLLWGRQGRWRLEAEFVRDVALQLSDLLVVQHGGKSVKPLQPAGYWQHLNFPKRKWIADQGESLYRRGLYTYRCRSFPHPAMVSYDAPSREECTSQRSRSNIPQQALVLLNDPVFVETARKFAERAAKVDGDIKAKINFVWREATSRDATGEEIEILEELYQTQLERYAKAEADAKAFLSVGSAPGDESIALAEAAAWTQVTRAVLNAYETISRN